MNGLYAVEKINASNLPATINQNTTLSIQNSPYIANQDVTVLPGVILTVDPGVVIKFAVDAGLYVKGQIEMNGNASNIISLEPVSGNDKWEVISLIENTGPSILSYVKIRGCTIGDLSNRDRSAISVYKSDIIIENVDISDVKAPIYLNECFDAVIRDSKIFCSEVSDYIKVSNGSATIDNCDFIGSSAANTDAIDIDASSVTITSNQFHDFTGFNSDGVDCGGIGSSAEIQGNIFKNIADKAISVGETGVSLAEQNIIINCSIGMGATGLGNLTANNNTFYSNDTAFAAYLDPDVGYGAGIINAKNCILSNSDVDFVKRNNATINISFSLSDSDIIPGTGNIKGDPLFVNPGAGIFNLQSVSPAIDSGDPSSPIDPDGTRNDIGAIYFNQGVTDPTELPSVISSNKTLVKSESPYIANNDIVITPNVTLTVEAGVVIWFSQNTGMYIEGNVRFNGLEDDKIVLRTAPGHSNWDVVTFINASGKSSMTYVDISGCTHGNDLDRDRAAVNAHDSPEIILDHVVFSDVASAVYYNGATEECTFNNCYFEANERGSILFIVSSTVNILDCEFKGNDGRNSDAIDFDKVNAIIKGNIIYDMTESDSDGIDVGSRSDVTVTDNFISNCGDSGIESEEESILYASRNIIINCGIGVTVKEMATGTIENNTLFNNTQGFAAYGENHEPNHGGTVYVKNNIISNTQTIYTSEDNSQYTFSYNLCDSEIISGTGNIFGDPLFVNAAAGNFNLRSDSPAIDGGDPNSPIDEDGTRADIGAIAYGQVVITNIIITEIHYKPLVSGIENKNLEFIELYNTSGEIIYLNNYSFSSGITYTFGAEDYIDPGEYIIIAKNIDYYESKVQKGFEWFTGDLFNNGELIKLEDNEGNTVISLMYSSTAPWPSAPTYGNYSIELNNVNNQYTFPGNWRLSSCIGGTPAKPNHEATIEGLYINEFVANYESLYPDELGQLSDWIEIYNAGANPINVGGLYFTDNFSEPEKYQIPQGVSDSTIIQPGGFLVFRADARPEYGILHLGFELSSSGEQIGISQNINNSYVYIDSIRYEYQEADISFGRIPDGTGNFQKLSFISPGSSNSEGDDITIESIYINEIASDCELLYPDEHGLISDWIEIYNNSGNAIDIGGLYFTDTYEEPFKYKIPLGKSDSTTIDPWGYIVLRADGKPELGITHLEFELRSSGEQVGIFQNVWSDTVLIDSLTFTGIDTDASYGRYPDGNTEFMNFNTPTPGYKNQEGGVNIGQQIFINEFVSDYESQYPDEHGIYSDWIEIYNGKNVAVDLGGLYFTDTFEEPMKFQIPSGKSDSTTIQPYGYMVFRADGKPELGVNHLGFELRSSGEQIGIYQKSGINFLVIDSVTFGVTGTDISYGRSPDGSDNFTLFSVITPGYTNGSQPDNYNNLHINELVSNYEAYYPDEFGNYSDWIEIYNSGNQPINIGGLYITDDYEENLKYQIPLHYPDSTTIPPGGYIVLRADGNPELGILHINFELSSSGERVGLHQYLSDNIIVIDSLSFGSMGPDISFGRYPDGSDNFVEFDAPTPGQTNISNVRFKEKIFINEIVSNYENFYPDEHGIYSDWIEIFNLNNYAVDIGGLYITDTLGEPLKYRIPTSSPDSTTINPGGFIVLRADGNPDLGILHIDFELRSGGEQIGISQKIGNDIRTLDSFTFAELEPDYSYGRYPDGGPTFQQFTNPTPETSNTGSGSGINDIQNSLKNNLSLYPNPFSEGVNIRAELIEPTSLSITIIDLTGKMVVNLVPYSNIYLYGNHLFYWNGTADNGDKVPEGLYFVVLRTENSIDVKKAIIVN